MRQYVPLLTCLCFLAFFLCCCSRANETKQPKVEPAETSREDSNSETSIDSEYYEMDDFSKIVIGESTLDDVLEIIPLPESPGFAVPTSYGSAFHYPSKNNSQIVVAFNDDWVVIDIFQVKTD